MWHVSIHWRTGQLSRAAANVILQLHPIILAEADLQDLQETRKGHESECGSPHCRNSIHKWSDEAVRVLQRSFSHPFS
eukprot:4480603-Amphidinium_carterae.1